MLCIIKRLVLWTYTTIIICSHQTLLQGYSQSANGNVLLMLPAQAGVLKRKNNENERPNICKYLFVSGSVFLRGCVVRARRRCVCARLRARCARWSAVSKFGQKVNNYSAYSVIMVSVSPAAGEEGATGRLSSSVMKYRHRGALYTWIFINTGLTVMRAEQVGWDTQRVRSIRQEAVVGVGVVKATGRSSPCRKRRAVEGHGCTPTHRYM